MDLTKTALTGGAINLNACKNLSKKEFDNTFFILFSLLETSLNFVTF